ncbi:MAG: tetratricopeptide repeat protein [Bacteroidetes bacterium]|nr:tetratricopeptide repeat protein [Bacteroidota bacterium]
MKKVKLSFFFLIVLFSFNTLFAQSIDEGKKFIYYERFTSAKNIFQKILEKDPNNESAAYYYGQALIGLEKPEEAKAFYLSKLSANPNSPLLLAGVGEVELIENKTADARNRFETAISLSKGKSIDVLNAVGLANSDPEIRNGDANYAIDKLKQATTIKGFKSAEVYTNLGDAYRKAGNGGEAIQAYNSALAIDPGYVRALYRIGKIYQTQGYSQEPLFMKYYNDVIAKDPAYAPVYANLFNYFYNTNVPRAAEYLDKWLQNSDDDPKGCYYRASIKYAQGLFNDAILKADECIAKEGSSPYPNLYGIKAIAYNRLNDTVNAKKSFDEYFKRQSPDKIGAGDYANYATLLLKFPGNEDEVAKLVDKAVAMDTTESNKVSYLKMLGTAYEERNNPAEAAKWYAKIMDVKKNFSNVDLFNAGYNFYLADKLDSSNKYFQIYTEKYPNDILGYYMLGNAYSVIDSTGNLGLAVPYYEKTIAIGEADTTQPNVKPRLLNAYKFFIGYYYNTKKDKDMALQYVDKALAIAPDDSQLATFKEIISKNDPKAPKKSTGPKGK